MLKMQHLILSTSLGIPPKVMKQGVYEHFILIKYVSFLSVIHSIVILEAIENPDYILLLYLLDSILPLSLARSTCSRFSTVVKSMFVYFTCFSNQLLKLD